MPMLFLSSVRGLIKLVKCDSGATRSAAIEVGTALFYHLTTFMNDETKFYPPTRQFFSSCIEILGQVRALKGNIVMTQNNSHTLPLCLSCRLIVCPSGRLYRLVAHLVVKFWMRLVCIDTGPRLFPSPSITVPVSLPSSLPISTPPSLNLVHPSNQIFTQSSLLNCGLTLLLLPFTLSISV